MIIGRQRGQATVVNRTADSKMIETLVRIIVKPKKFVHQIVEVTPYSGASNSMRFRFQVQDLAD
jgi:hypothetical protein